MVSGVATLSLFLAHFAVARTHLLSFTLLFSHGNAEDLGLIIRCAKSNEQTALLSAAESQNTWPEPGTFES